MANTLITPDLVARLAYANLYERIIVTGLVHRDYSADFMGAQGDTITVRKPAIFAADEWNGSTITVQNATETSFDVKLDTILDVSFEVPAKERTLEVSDFNSQFIVPAVEALVQGIEEKILTLRDDITQVVGDTTEDPKALTDPSPYYNPRVLVDAGRELNKNKVPLTERYAVVGPVTQAAWMKDPLFHEADKRGDTEGLREASIGRKLGFDVYGTTHIESPEDVASGSGTVATAPTEVGVAFHRTAFALVMRALNEPEGASSASFGDRGVGVRVVRDYDMDKKADVISLDVLVGVKTLDANRAVLIHGAEEGSGSGSGSGS